MSRPIGRDHILYLFEPMFTMQMSKLALNCGSCLEIVVEVASRQVCGMRSIMDTDFRQYYINTIESMMSRDIMKNTSGNHRKCIQRKQTIDKFPISWPNAGLLTAL